MSDNFKHQLKLSGDPTDTATWARIDHDGRLVIEFYDFSEQAQSAFGNDVAYLLIVASENKSLALSKLEAGEPPSAAQSDRDLRLLDLLQRLGSYFRIQEWFQANDIPFEKQFDDWA